LFGNDQGIFVDERSLTCLYHLTILCTINYLNVPVLYTYPLSSGRNYQQFPFLVPGSLKCPRQSPLIMLSTLAALFLLALPLTLCSPAPIPAAAAAAEHPMITPSPSEWSPTKTFNSRRGVVSDLEGDVNSVLSALGSNIPSYVASGVPNFFQDFPTGDKVKSSLGLNDSQIAALPTQVLNIP